VAKRIYAFFWELFHIFFRHYNFPCELEMIRVGNPNDRSPVFVSGNYTLVVKRLLRVLKGTDCYLLVANSRGSNVWCAAGMNEFTEHDIIDAINVADLGKLVKHRRIIAPPYGAPGVDVRAVKKETGFNIIWGPTHLNDIPRFIQNNYKRTNDMVQVQFGFQDRMEQALSTSMAYSMTVAVGLFFWPRYILTLMGLIFFTYCFGFSLWNLFPEERRWAHTLTIGATIAALLAGLGLLRGWAPRDFAVWEASLAGIVLLMGGDGCGSTPIYKSTVKHWLTEGDYHSLFDPVIDPDLCTNCMACVLVCPKDVFAARRASVKTVVSVKPEECIECLACVKQCYDDAIFNRSGKYKDDVKSVPNLHNLMTRSWDHLREEDQWLHAPTKLHSGLPVVIEPPVKRTAEPRGDGAGAPNVVADEAPLGVESEGIDG